MQYPSPVQNIHFPRFTPSNKQEKKLNPNNLSIPNIEAIKVSIAIPASPPKATPERLHHMCHVHSQDIKPQYLHATDPCSPETRQRPPSTPLFPGEIVELVGLESQPIVATNIFPN